MNSSFNDFINYVLDFYGQNGIYDQGRTKEQIAYATTMYLDAVQHYANTDDKMFRHYTWGDGDSLDRERVRDIMNNYYGGN